MEDFSNIHVGDHVEIILLSNPTKQSKGNVYMILSTEPEKTIVVLDNGAKGKISRIINSEDVIKKRIMNEDQYSENKENFTEDIMRREVIPRTVQSFLNSEGGYLYIGIKDTGNLKERLVGLDYDFQIIEKKKDHTTDKVLDMLEIEILDSLEKYLESNIPIGPLIKINFPIIDNIQIIEIMIKKSSAPWFYKYVKNNKQQKFEFKMGDKITQRCLDDFYIRRGGSKKLLETHKEVYDYLTERFTNSYTS